MAVYRPDGSVYKPSGSINQLGAGTPSHDLFNGWDQEAIKAGGSPIHYYEVYIPISGIDPLYGESKNKFYSSCPIELYAVYEPVQPHIYVAEQGIDGPDTVVFTLNYQAVLDALGHLPNIGARIYTPHLGENWEIVDRRLTDFQRYKVYHVELHCVRFTEDRNIQGGKVTQNGPKPNYTID